MVGDWDIAAGIVQLTLLCILIYPYAVGLSIEHDPIQKLRGWDRVVAEAAKLGGETDVVTTDHYSIQSLGFVSLAIGFDWFGSLRITNWSSCS